MDLKNRIVIVTGASSGIGLATAKLLTEHGAKVALASRSVAVLEKLSANLSGSFVVPTNMTDPAAIKKMIELTRDHFGRIDILVNNAGQGYNAPVEFTDLKIFQQIINLDVFGPLIAMQSVIPLMRRQGGGTIVNISSATSVMALPSLGAYSSAKRMLNALSLTAREELAPDHITVSLVYPYITDTNFYKNSLSKKEHAFHPDHGPFKADSAGMVALKIIEVINSGAAEIFVHPLT